MRDILSLIVGVFTITSVFYTSRYHNKLIKTSEKTKGIVVAYQQKINEKKCGYVSAPVIVFLSKENKKVCFTSKLYSDPPLFKVGKRVKIFYDPITPENAHINNSFSLWWFLILMSLLAVIVIVMSINSMFFMVDLL